MDFSGMLEIIKKILFDCLLQLFNFKEGLVIMLILSWIQQIPSFYWIPILLGTCVLYLHFIKLMEHFIKSPLKIIYENGKYNDQLIKLDRYEHPSRYNACIVAIHNKSKKTVCSVNVCIKYEEKLDKLRTLNGKEYKCDINPNQTEKFIIGEIVHPCKGTEIVITATGKDIKSITKTITL
ncbi:MAG: hypothetical protein EBZ58_13345 [Bacteroidetes bacterium]|nr:hypothetical protein [Bacteroidota bacterium]